MNEAFFFFALYIAVLVGLTWYFLWLMTRIARAQEQTSRHLLEIARDVKTLAHKSENP